MGLQAGKQVGVAGRQAGGGGRQASMFYTGVFAYGFPGLGVYAYWSLVRNLWVLVCTVPRAHLLGSQSPPP